MARKIVIVTDAWTPQVNGVVVTLLNTKRELESRGYEVHVISSEYFTTFPLWFYPEIQITEPVQSALLFSKLMQYIKPDIVHIATEGTLGMIARSWCKKNDFPFTTAYHTKFPEYIKNLVGLPEELTYAYLRWFHGASSSVFVTTPAMKDELASYDIHNTVVWSRGVNTEIFNPSHIKPTGVPYILYVGRVSAEKNLQAFLDLDVPYWKKVVGDGPQLEWLKKQYPDVEWLGARTQMELPPIYANAVCFVFPSITDTFGLVMIEAISCGTPVAAFDTEINRSILSSEVAVLSDNLEAAVYKAARLKDTNVEICAQWAKDNYSWAAATDRFIANLVTKNT